MTRTDQTQGLGPFYFGGIKIGIARYNRTEACQQYNAPDQPMGAGPCFQHIRKCPKEQDMPAEKANYFIKKILDVVRTKRI